MVVHSWVRAPAEKEAVGLVRQKLDRRERELREESRVLGSNDVQVSCRSFCEAKPGPIGSKGREAAQIGVFCGRFSPRIGEDRLSNRLLRVSLGDAGQSRCMWDLCA